MRLIAVFTAGIDALVISCGTLVGASAARCAAVPSTFCVRLCAAVEAAWGRGYCVSCRFTACGARRLTAGGNISGVTVDAGVLWGAAAAAAAAAATFALGGMDEALAHAELASVVAR